MFDRRDFLFSALALVALAAVLFFGSVRAARACMGPRWETLGEVLAHPVEFEVRRPFAGSFVCIDRCEYRAAPIAAKWPTVVYVQTGSSCVPPVPAVPVVLPCKRALGAGRVNGVRVCLR